MAEIDASIYRNIVQPDPLGKMRELAETGTAFTQNQLAQTELLKKRAIGDLLTNALDPETGELDNNRLIQLMKTNPAAWSAASDVVPLNLAAQGSQIANRTAATNLASIGIKNLGTIWGSRLASTEGPISYDDALRDVMDGVATGRIPAKQGLAVIRSMPEDSNELRNYMTGGYIQALPPELAAGVAPAPPTAEGAPVQQTGGQFVTQSLGGVRRQPPSGDGTINEPGATAARPGVVTGLSPSESEARKPIGTASGANFVNLQNLANQVPDRMGMLQNMQADAAQFTSGPPSERIRELVAGINTLFGTDFNVEGVAAQERFNKLANQIALQQSGAMGVTDLTTKTAMGANPHTGMSNLGIQGVTNVLMGNEDAIRTKAMAGQNFLDAGGKADQFGKWSSRFNQDFDPRVFQSVYMSPEERNELIKTMPEVQLKEFRRKYNLAVRNKWIEPPGAE